MIRCPFLSVLGILSRAPRSPPWPRSCVNLGALPPVGAGSRRILEALQPFAGHEEQRQEVERRAHAQDASAAMQAGPFSLAVQSFSPSPSSVAWSAKASSSKSGERPRKLKRLGELPRSSVA